MTVLHVLPSLDEAYGGPLRLVLDLSARAEEYGLSSEVLGVGLPKLRDNPLSNSKVHSVPGSGSYAYSPSLRNWLRRNLGSYDGVVIHGAWTYPGFAVAMECKRATVPYACFPHGMLENWAIHGQGVVKAFKKQLYWSMIERRICQDARCLFFTTQREEQLTDSTFSLSSPGRILRPYGIDAASELAQEPDNANLRQPDSLKVALFLGRLHPKKNLKLLIEAWKGATIGSDWRLVIAGSGSVVYESELNELVRSYDLKDKICLTGFVSGLDKTYLLGRAAWFLLPSSQENFGVAVLEAIQNRCAVALSDQVYLTESMRRESEVIPLKAEAWAEFFSTRMQDPEWTRTVSDLDYSHLLPTFEMDRVVRSWAVTLSDVFGPK